jgi:hypothetical protein
VKTTTSQAPTPARVGTTAAGGAWAPGSSAGKRLPKTATSQRPAGTSVGLAGSVVGASGFHSGGGMKVRSWRCAAYATHSPRRRCQRRCGFEVTGSPGGTGAGAPSVRTGWRPYRTSGRPSGLVSTIRCMAVQAGGSPWSARKRSMRARHSSSICCSRAVRTPRVASAMCSTGTFGVRSAKSRPFASW